MATLTQTHESFLNSFRGLPYVEQMKLLRSLMDEVVSHVVEDVEPDYSPTFVAKIRESQAQIERGEGMVFDSGEEAVAYLSQRVANG